MAKFQVFPGVGQPIEDLGESPSRPAYSASERSHDGICRCIAIILASPPRSRCANGVIARGLKMDAYRKRELDTVLRWLEAVELGIEGERLLHVTLDAEEAITRFR